MRILIVDDHQMLCVGFAEHLERVVSQISTAPIVVTPVFSLVAAIEAVAVDDHPDLVFLDLDLGDGNQGALTLERFQQGNPHDVPVVVFTGLSLTEEGTTNTLRHCLKNLRAKGILLKGADLKTALIGIARILAGELWMPQEVLIALATAAPERPQPSKYHLGLSPREWEVARCLARGLQDKVIASELGLSHGYVRQVTRQIYEKLDVNTRIQAVIKLKDFHQNTV